MSEPLRIAVAVEGPTDAIVIQAILQALLPDTEFEFHTLQPEGSIAFDSAPSTRTGVGWVGVYRWSRQAVSEGGGSVSGSSALLNHDWECRPNPEDQLAALPIHQRFRKRPEDYRGKQAEITEAWPKVSARLTEAARFETEFLAAVPA